MFQNLFRSNFALLFLVLLSIGASAATFTVPLMQGQDPEVEMHNGTFNLVLSDGCNIHLRQSATMGGLVSASDQIVLSPGCSNVWAPEIHWFTNKWYLYYSLGNPDHPNHRVYVAQQRRYHRFKHDHNQHRGGHLHA